MASMGQLSFATLMNSIPLNPDWEADEFCGLLQKFSNNFLQNVGRRHSMDSPLGVSDNWHLSFFHPETKTLALGNLHRPLLGGWILVSNTTGRSTIVSMC